MSSKRLA